MPERPKGADCKSAGTAYGGSNPSRPTRRKRAGQSFGGAQPRRQLSCWSCSQASGEDTSHSRAVSTLEAIAAVEGSREAVVLSLDDRSRRPGLSDHLVEALVAVLERTIREATDEPARSRWSLSSPPLGAAQGPGFAVGAGFAKPWRTGSRCAWAARAGQFPARPGARPASRSSPSCGPMPGGPPRFIALPGTRTWAAPTRGPRTPQPFRRRIVGLWSAVPRARERRSRAPLPSRPNASATLHPSRCEPRSRRPVA